MIVPPAQSLPPASSRTVWNWLIVALPILTSILAFGYLADWQRIFPQIVQLMVDDVARVDRPTCDSAGVASELMSLFFELFFSPWLWTSFILGWGAYAASVRFAVLDVRALTGRGFLQPFPWAWTFLSPLVYVIGRHVVVRRQGSTERAPLMVSVISQSLAFVAMTYWTVVLTMQALELMLPMVFAR